MNNLPHGVLPSDIPGESRRDQAHADTVQEIIYLLIQAEGEGVDRLQVLMDALEEMFPRFRITRRLK